MRYGVIDIGSNTIRTVIYEIEKENARQIISEKDFTGILNYIVNGEISTDGIVQICTVLNKMNSLCKLLSCEEIHAFSTASLRNVKNTESVLEAVREIGLNIVLLSGDDEAECDFYGLMAEGCDADGVGFDVGGGSAQIFEFRNNELRNKTSVHTGSLRMYNKFVRGIVPAASEIKLIKKYVRSEMEKHEEFKKLKYHTAYAIGGSARALAKLHRALTGQESALAGYELTLEQMDEIYDLMKHLDMRGIRLIEKVAPERINTLIPGLTVIRTITRFIGAQKIKVVKSGVREGYLCRHILNRTKT